MKNYKLYDFTDAFRWYLYICSFGILLFLVSCWRGPKYEKGDIVYVKPDSIEAVINDTWEGPKYEILTDSLKPLLVSEEAIFGKY